MDSATLIELKKQIAMLQLENETLHFQIKQKDEEIKTLKHELEDLKSSQTNHPSDSGSWMIS